MLLKTTTDRNSITWDVCSNNYELIIKLILIQLEYIISLAMTSKVSVRVDKSTEQNKQNIR